MSLNPKQFMEKFLCLGGRGSRTSMALLFLYVFLGPAAVFVQPVAAQNQTQWAALPDIDTLTSPAVCEHSDGQIYIVGIAFNGLVAFTSSATPDGWKPWEIIGPQPATGIGDPAFYADPNTEPTLLREAADLYLIVRGKKQQPVCNAQTRQRRLVRLAATYLRWPGGRENFSGHHQAGGRGKPPGNQ